MAEENWVISTFERNARTVAELPEWIRKGLGLPHRRPEGMAPRSQRPGGQSHPNPQGGRTEQTNDSDLAR